MQEIVNHGTGPYPGQEFVNIIEQDLLARHLSNHPLYQKWNAGTLSMDALKAYAQQYYQFVAAFPRFVSRVHSNTPHTDVRFHIQQNLREEEDPNELHEELWINFAEGLGLQRSELDCELLPETQKTMDKFYEVCSRSFIEGSAALLAYESQISDIAELKMDGLKKFYDVTSEKTLKFFEVHKVADIEHQKVWKRIIGEYSKTDEQKTKVRKALDESMDAMWGLLDGTHRVYC